MSDYRLSDYEYMLPEELIAAYPPRNRGDSRLMVMSRCGDSEPVDAMFCDLPKYLPAGALLVANNSRVLPARLHGARASGGKVEFLLLSPLPLILAKAVNMGNGKQMVHGVECLLRMGGKPRIGEFISFGSMLDVELLEKGDYGRYRVNMYWQGSLKDIFAHGEIPLPPYLKRRAEEADRLRYQTVYGNPEKAGSVAAPTAGLHFTDEMRKNLAQHGFGWTEITLYVGYGTFSPVRCADIREHEMHPEYVEISQSTAEAIRNAQMEKRPVIAIGTTSIRALEGVAQKYGEITQYADWLNIFLYPGKNFKIASGLITNFHLPGSTLLMLVSAFAERSRVLDAYARAIEKKYRFFSYGDAMLIV